MKSNLQFMLFFLVLGLSACSVTTAVNESKDVRATENANIVLLGYTIPIGMQRIDGLEFKCLDKLNNKKVNCFNIPVNTASRQLNAVRAYKMQYGQYQLDEINITIYAGMRPQYRCYKQSNGKQKCTREYIPQYKNVIKKLDVNLGFLVEQGKGLYLGHLYIDKKLEDIVKTADVPINVRVLKQFETDLNNIEDDALVEQLRKHIRQ